MIPIATFEGVKNTFFVTYVLLLTTGSITFIEALTTQNPIIRHVLNLETVVSIIASFFYSQFVSRYVNSAGVTEQTVNYIELTKTRYLDWSITTPFMLLALCLVLAHNQKRTLSVTAFMVILFLDYGMLWTGYLGEAEVLSKNVAFIISFLFFIALFAYIYFQFVAGAKSYDNYVLFSIYTLVWSIYGFVYYTDNVIKNVSYNILDLIAKCFIGIFLWIYLVKVLDFRASQQKLY